MISMRKKYIELGQGIFPHERQWLEQSIQAVLPPTSPSDRFVFELGGKLVQDAERYRQLAQKRARELYLLGVIGGGLSVAGGLIVWMLWRRRRTPADVASSL